VTDDVETPAVVDPAADAAPPAAGNGSGGGSGDGPSAADGADTPDAPARRDTKRSAKRAALEWGILIVVAIVIAIVIKTFLFQAFYIPSASMVPTLEVGDRVLVNKLSYDFHDVHRGDIVVFAAEPNQRWHRAGIDDLVKRVIALPGETITQCETDRVCIDGRLLNESYLPKVNNQVVPTTNMESIPGCAPDSPPNGCKVPAGEIFVMGDNRTNSQDARANGPIKESSIVGRVFLRIWPPGRIGFM
jgi:signal peptidase I